MLSSNSNADFEHSFSKKMKFRTKSMNIETVAPTVLTRELIFSLNDNIGTGGTFKTLSHVSIRITTANVYQHESRLDESFNLKTEY